MWTAERVYIPSSQSPAVRIVAALYCRSSADAKADRKQTPPHESTDVEKENDRQASAAAPDLNGHEQTAIDTLISNVTAEEKSTPSTPGSRKRRKLNSSRASTPNVANHSSPPSENRRHHTRSVRQSEEGPLATADARIQTRPSTPQESETLKLNGKGGFKTPEKAKKDVRHDHEHVEQTRSPKRRGRPPKRKSFVVCLRYDFDGTEKGKLAIGEKIDSILASPLSRPKERTPEIRVPLLAHATNPSKPTHPFFSGKPAPRKEVPRNDAGDEQREEPKPARIKSFTTPVKMRHPGPAADSLTTRPDFTSFVSSKRPTLLGTKEAMWPPRDFQHHRHSPDPDYISLPHSIHSRVLKQKGKRFELGVDETITTHFTRLLKSTGAWHGRASDTNAIDLPLRSVESGRHLQRRIEDRLAGVKLHPAAINLQNKVGKTLSAFDRAECETQAWTTKYQPRCAQHVLQSEREMSALRSWLASLTVDAVRGGSSSDAKSGPSKGDEKPKRKRRKMKNGELDDFIVDGDDDGELAAFSQDELAPSGDTQSVIRELASFSSNGKKMNAVLISGTSGCGKTAAVHAVARELGYEVFEINSSSRRSGKDMLDRVGDMTLNHQVQHGQQGSFAPSATEAELPPPKNSLGAFFKAGHSAIVPKKRTKGKKEPEKAPSKKQRQALVLLEEVDILFDDDKQFWETVQTLATNSRRPIIMTCTDESQIPLEDLSLYAILRFRPPSVDLAAPYLLAMSAAEGHVLKLDDVAGLFREKHEDLRASINELQLYCQMAVGDTKGGLDWSLERWPPGVDKDASGEILHVVSNGTYRTAVGAPRGGTTSEILAEGWAKHQVEPLFLAEKMGLEGMEKDARPQMAKLAATSAFLDDLSTADALGSVDLPSGQTVGLTYC